MCEINKVFKYLPPKFNKKYRRVAFKITLCWAEDAYKHSIKNACQLLPA